LKASLTQSGREVRGRLAIISIGFDVRGRVEDDGSLVLTGEGTHTFSGAAVSLNAWRTKGSSGAMSGSFTYTSVTGRNSIVIPTPFTVTYELETLVLPGVTPP